MESKRGQVTIFVIIAIVIVVAGVLIYMFYPRAGLDGGFDSKNPGAFIQACLEDDIKDDVAALSLQGGSLEPEFYILYDNSNVEYLCYINEYYKPCVMQQPMLKSHIEGEIESDIGAKASECFNELVENYEDKGESVKLVEGGTSAELLPRKIVVGFEHVLTLTKAGSERFENFEVVLNNNLYELIGITNSILEWEALYGDADTSTYMNYYHDLKVEKKKQDGGSTIYILTNRDTGDKFQFASRSVVWPSGYGLE